MKKHIRLLLTACLALCMMLCMGLAVACKDDGQKTFTITVVYEDGTPTNGLRLQYCSEGDEGSCITETTDSNGKVSFDITTDKWKSSSDVHVRFLDLWLDGYAVYKNDTLLDYDASNSRYDDHVDHHKVYSVKYTLKLPPEAVEAGYDYEVKGLAQGASRTYTTVVKADAAYLDVNVHGGEFGLSVLVNGNALTGVTDTLNATNSHVYLNLGDFNASYGSAVSFTITPKNADSTQLDFNFCPVYELGATLNAANTDVYKAYFNLPSAHTEIAFIDPLEDGFFNLDGFPITLTVGTDTPVVWDEASYISNIETDQTGDVLFTFAFADDATANLYVTVANANDSSDDTLTLGKSVSVTLPNMFDGAEYKFTSESEQAEAYIITFTGYSEDTWVQFTVGYAMSDPFLPSEHDGIIEYEFPAGVEVTITFGTYNEAGESFSFVLSAKAK